MIWKRGIILLFLFLFLINYISSTNYYVCDNGIDCNSGDGSDWSTGSDSYDGKSRDRAFKTIQKAADIVNPGDTVIVGDGHYTDSNSIVDITGIILALERSGTSDNWITYKSENKYGAVIDGIDGSRDNCIYIYGASYQFIEGFEIKDCNSKGIKFQGMHHIKILDNWIHHIGRTWSDPDCTGGYDKIPTGIGSKQDVYNVTVKGNIIHDIGRLHNSACQEATSANYNTCNWDHNIYATGKLWLIQNNIIYNAHCGWLIKIDDYDGETTLPTHIVSNNIFAHDVQILPSVDGHVHITESHDDLRPHDVIVQNNVFYNPYQYAISLMYFMDASTMIFENNAMTGELWGRHTWGDKVIHNSEPITRNNYINANLGMQDPNNNDFMLLENSVLIDKGILNQYTPNLDFDGNPRDNLPDIGAYEYQGLPSDCSSGADISVPSDDIVSIQELISYISQWKLGLVSINELISAIGEWKNGCS